MTEITSYKITDALNLIADKWTVPLLTTIGQGYNRFGQFQRVLPDISRKMLTQTLRKMQRDGLIERIDYREAPSHVEYKLTPMGDELRARLCLSGLCQWSQEFFSGVESARQAFDGSQTSLR